VCDYVIIKNEILHLSDSYAYVYYYDNETIVTAHCQCFHVISRKVADSLDTSVNFNGMLLVTCNLFTP